MTPWDGPDRKTILNTVTAKAQPLLDLKEDPIKADVATSQLYSIAAEIAASTITPQSTIERAEKFAQENGLTLPKACFATGQQQAASSQQSATDDRRPADDAKKNNKKPDDGKQNKKNPEEIKKNDPENAHLKKAACVFTDLMQQAIKTNVDAAQQKQSQNVPSKRSLIVGGASIGIELLRTVPFGSLIVAGIQGIVFATSMGRDQSYEYVLATPVKVGDETGFAHHGPYNFARAPGDKNTPYSVLVYPLTAALTR